LVLLVDVDRDIACLGIGKFVYSPNVPAGIAAVVIDDRILAAGRKVAATAPTPRTHTR